MIARDPDQRTEEQRRQGQALGKERLLSAINRVHEALNQLSLATGDLSTLVGGVDGWRAASGLCDQVEALHRMLDERWQVAVFEGWPHVSARELEAWLEKNSQTEISADGQ